MNGRRGAPQGNRNARLYKHPGRTIRLNGADADLLYDFFALEGNGDPSNAEFTNAVRYAIRQVYGRRIEDGEYALSRLAT